MFMLLLLFLLVHFFALSLMALYGFAHKTSINGGFRTGRRYTLRSACWNYRLIIHILWQYQHNCGYWKFPGNMDRSNHSPNANSYKFIYSQFGACWRCHWHVRHSISGKLCVSFFFCSFLSFSYLLILISSTVYIFRWSFVAMFLFQNIHIVYRLIGFFFSMNILL